MQVKPKNPMTDQQTIAELMAENEELKEALLNANQHQVTEVEHLTKQLTESEANCAAMREAVELTLKENGHLSDGEVCTLIRLKRALAPTSGSEILERLERYKKALDKLARLGNEPHFGNSVGNAIAQAALTAQQSKGENEQR